MSIIKIRLTLLLILLALPFHTTKAALQRLTDFRSVTENSGIPLSGITSLTIDDDGFIWGGSRMGVIRATPSDCRIFELPSSISNLMQVKVAYNKGVLAATTQNGRVFRFDPVKSRFEHWFTLTPSLGKRDWVTNIVVDSNGNLWASTSKGIFINDEAGLRKLEGTDDSYSYILPLSDKEIFALIGNEMFIIDSGNKTRRALKGNFGQLISAGAYDSFNKRIWLGTYQGEIWKYDPATGDLEKTDLSHTPGFIVRSLVVPDDHTLIAGFEGEGIIIADSGTGEVKGVIKENIDKPTSLKGNSVSALLIDNQKRLWVATTNGGLQFSETDRKGIEHLKHIISDGSSLSDNNINGLMTDRRGRLWIATNDGISRQDRETGLLTHIMKGKGLSVLSMAQGRDGEVYVSTYSDGVYVIDENSGNILHHFTGKDAAIFGPGSFVFATFADSESDIWFGGVKGEIVCLSVEDNTFRKYGQHPVFCFAEAEPGKILTGGGDGLIIFDKKSGKEEIALPDNVVEDMVVDGNDVWVCTTRNGVIKMDLASGTRQSITTKEGLHSNFTCSLLISGDYLWISTLQGISCYDLRKREMVTLPGLELLTRNSFRENSATMLHDGKIAFGSNNGVAIFDPDTVMNINTKGNLYFSDIRLSGQSIRDNEDYALDTPIDNLTELRIDYPKNSFTLSVLPMGNVGSSVGYSWKLEGADNTWSEITPLNYINYANLQPGKYILHIRMHDGGIVSERSLNVIVRPPFWKRGWFRGLIVLVIILVAALAVRLIILRMEQRYANEKIAFFTQMTHDLRDSLLMIKKPIEELEKEEDISEMGKKCRKMASDEIDKLCDNMTRLINFENEEMPSEQPSFVTTDLAAIIKKGTEISVETGANNEFLRKAEECVKENLGNENFGKGEFASAMMISQSLLYKKIKSLTDMSVVEFIRSIRLNRAKELLEEGKNNVTEVSEICGFSSSAYFSRVFKEYFGKTPSEVMSPSGSGKAAEEISGGKPE